MAPLRRVGNDDQYNAYYDDCCDGGNQGTNHVRKGKYVKKMA
jgi:hypothetical protein